MHRRAVAAAALLLAAGSAAAGSGAKFTLGLSGEYLGDAQEIQSVTVDRSSLQMVVGLAVVGHVVDPRFMTFDASIAKALTDQQLTGQPDSDVDETYYNGALRFFTNRAVSFEVGAGRQGTDITGFSQGAIVDGTRDYQRYALRALGGRWFRLNLRHEERSFEADDPSTLRDEDTSWSELKARVAAGKVDALMQLLVRENDIFGGGLQQEIGSGRFDLDVNRAGRVYWHTDLVGNLYRSAQNDGPFTPWTETYLVRNLLRHRYSELGFWDLRADLRTVRFDSDPLEEEEIVTGNLAAVVVAPLNRSAFLEGEVGYLSNEFGDGLRVTQPRASLGLRWGRRYGRWWVSANPRVTYLRAEPEGLEQESSLGSFIYATVRYQLRRSSVTVEGEYFDNQLTIPEDAIGEPPAGSAFLIGLDRRRTRARVIFDIRPSRRTGLTFEGDFRNRVRVSSGAEITEETARARATLVLGTVAIGASGDRFEVTGGDIPSLTDVLQGSISWRPAYWLLFDAFVRTEERRLFDFTGRYDFAEIGLQLSYAKLSFFARVREQRTEEAGLEQRRFRRVWVGVRRLFDFRVGERVR
ncbi:MAG TPA: hypothetical protein VLT32_11535 [Candidatus Sulfomarinibacteraceae bacterium]|nr:hypothetical protein [Candidatus Sulfomarinibacteraceae bacterium]